MTWADRFSMRVASRSQILLVGFITRDQFFAPNGLVMFARDELPSLLHGEANLVPPVFPSGPVPDIQQDRRVSLIQCAQPHFQTQCHHRAMLEGCARLRYRLGWFKHFDEDGTGELTQEEMVRALIKTFKLGSDVKQERTTCDRGALARSAEVVTTTALVCRRRCVVLGDLWWFVVE